MKRLVSAGVLCSTLLSVIHIRAEVTLQPTGETQLQRQETLTLLQEHAKFDQSYQPLVGWYTQHPEYLDQDKEIIMLLIKLATAQMYGGRRVHEFVHLWTRSIGSH